MDGRGRLWTLVDSKGRRSDAYGRLWTPVDSAWRSTDQEVGDSSPSGRADETRDGRLIACMTAGLLNQVDPRHVAALRSAAGNCVLFGLTSAGNCVLFGLTLGSEIR